MSNFVFDITRTDKAGDQVDYRVKSPTADLAQKAVEQGAPLPPMLCEKPQECDRINQGLRPHDQRFQKGDIVFNFRSYDDAYDDDDSPDEVEIVEWYKHRDFYKVRNLNTNKEMYRKDESLKHKSLSGGANYNYYVKYCKYKSKYLRLKNSISNN